MNTSTRVSQTPAMRITIALLGAQLKQETIETTLIHTLAAMRYRDAYCITPPSGECWLFDYGALVAWNVSESDRQQLCLTLSACFDAPAARQPIEQYAYHIEQAQPLLVHHDCLSLPDDQPLTRLALSHAFAQSAKLGYFEDLAQQVIQQNAHISKQLAQHGKVSLRRRDLAKLRGVLFDTSSDITLHFGLLDTPEFFWDYPELEDSYQKLAKYLDLQPRVDILTKKLATIQSLLEVLAAEQYHKHSAFLEWVIIWLIAVDIGIYFF